ncbi:MAG: VCBS repeat-containing protein, partial [Planctomycetes bacterium]|nr:VCBS repeat-containing protein [Planctomycetota bacterium]
PQDLWRDVTAQTIGETAEWTNKVELADIDGDGRVDVLLANGGDYDKPGTAVPTRVFRNAGDQPWPEITRQVFGERTFYARVVKARDIDGDGHCDLFVGATFQTQSRLYLGRGDGRFEDMTDLLLPKMPLSVGDAEWGDVDGDGDLDLVLADWGPGSPMKNDGARPRLWRNDGGRFVDVGTDYVPDIRVRFCWELELVDVDNDFDLDLLISSKRSPGSFLLHNDGRGRFTDVSEAKLPQFTNNYEFEPMDVDGDGYLDVVTINDGAGDRRFSEHLFRADGAGGFVDVTDDVWPQADNPRFDDNMIAFLDYDSDGDADFLIASLNGVDRLLVNDGRGRFAAAAPVFAGERTRATLGIAIADLNGDGRMDCVHAEGEVANAEADRVFFGASIAPDTAPPSIGTLDLQPRDGGVLVRVRVHDRKSPCMPHDWQQVVLRVDDGSGPRELPMRWYGEYLWAVTVEADRLADLTLVVEAIDAAGNAARSSPRSVRVH